MRLPRPTTRRLMARVALVAAVLGLANSFPNFPAWLQGIVMAISLPALTFLVFILPLLLSPE